MSTSGWVCLNTDGASKGEDGAAGCGGILRHDNGTWTAGFTKFPDNTRAYMSETWGLYEGLCLARNLGITRLEVQVDSEALVKAIQGSNVGVNMYWNIMKKIHELLNLNWEVRLTHIYREANRCADILANIGSNLTGDMMIYEEPPLEVRQVLFDDFRGVSLPRVILM